MHRDELPNDYNIINARQNMGNEYAMGVKTCTYDDKLGNTYGVANTLVDVPSAIGYIAVFKGPAINEICLCDNLTWSSSTNFNFT